MIRWLDELEAAAGRATPGPYDSGPETMAGYVWVYHHGDPLLEPHVPWYKNLPAAALFGIRRSVPERLQGEPAPEAKTRVWKQRQSDAIYFAACSPERIAWLVKVARAAQSFSDSYKYIEGDRFHEYAQDLVAILDALPPDLEPGA